MNTISAWFVKTRRFDVAVELLREGGSFTFDGVGLSLTPEGLLVAAVESSYSIENTSEQTALIDLRRARTVADYLAAKNSMFRAIYEQHQHVIMLVNYFGHGGETEVARFVDGNVVWAAAGSDRRDVCNLRSG